MEIYFSFMTRKVLAKSFCPVFDVLSMIFY
jgi:hypothetical protein